MRFDLLSRQEASLTVTEGSVVEVCQPPKAPDSIYVELRSGQGKVSMLVANDIYSSYIDIGDTLTIIRKGNKASVTWDASYRIEKFEVRSLNLQYLDVAHPLSDDWVYPPEPETRKGYWAWVIAISLGGVGIWSTQIYDLICNPEWTVMERFTARWPIYAVFLLYLTVCWTYHLRVWIRK